MSCRNDPDDPRKCERCGAFLWVAEEGLYCGACGSVMPCTMRIIPPPPTSETPTALGNVRTRADGTTRIASVARRTAP